MVKNLFKGCLTVPNLLSLIRIFLIPAFAVLYYKGHIGWAVLMLALSGISDFLDGKIARRFNQVSELGKILDPVADKLTQITIAVMLYLVMLVIIGFGPEIGAFRNYWTLPDPVLMVLVIISAILTIVAFASYMPATYRQVKEKHQSRMEAKGKK